MTQDLESSPNRIPWPPLILVGSAAAALALERLAPGAIPMPGAASAGGSALGWVLMAAGVGLDLWSIMTLLGHRTNFLPHRAAGKLVTSGPYALSRNPIYLGNILLLAGAGLAFGMPWFLICAFGSAILVHHLAIRREEVHLAAKFGADWDAYVSQTPRWIWRF